MSRSRSRSGLTIADYPTTTKWLSEEEKILAVVRLQVREQDEEHMSHKAALVEALKDPKTWVSHLYSLLLGRSLTSQTFMLAYNVLNSVGTISYFFPTLMTGLGYKGRTAQCKSIP